MLTWDQWVAAGAIALGSGGLGSVLTAIIGGLRKPSSQSELIEATQEAAEKVIARLEAEIERQATEFDRREKKLEAVAADLEEMVVLFIAWADSATEIAAGHGVTLPARPKFRVVGGGG